MKKEPPQAPCSQTQGLYDQHAPLFHKTILDLTQSLEDPAHDFLHFSRVVKTAKALCTSEGGNWEVVGPAAWLHDFVIVPKNHPDRKIASRLSATKAGEFLTPLGYRASDLQAIKHCIEAHSFSAQIEPTTLEAQIVQDADRLDGIGSIGIARCFSLAGVLKRPFYSQHDPFCSQRTPDDQTYTLDHFYQKLFKTAESLKTRSARDEGQRRVQAMRAFLEQLKREIE